MQAMKLVYNKTFCTGIAFLCAVFLVNPILTFAQPQKADNTIRSIERNKVDNSITSVFFTPAAKWREDQTQEIFSQYLGIDGVDNKMVETYTATAKSNVTARRYHQYYKGIKAEFGSYTFTIKNGLVTFITGNYYDFSAHPSIVPAIAESAAFATALQFVGADKYMWQDPLEEKRIKQMFHKPDTTFLPKGRLVWVDDLRSGVNDHKAHLAWCFDVFASTPISRQQIFIDAVTGKILLSNSLIKHTLATGHTKYSGVVPFQSSTVAGTFELYDSTRGSGIHTFNMNNGSSYGASTEYTSLANIWPMATPDSIALDAHWGAEVVYDFWNTVMGRLSYDNANGILLQYVHYNSGFNNAFWDGTEMTYGDGTGCGSGFTALASLDVTGHEIGHGVCQYTANLVYAGESGAMNEAFSDCWGASIENWGDPHEVDAVPKSTWGIGEEIKCGSPMRRMDFPKLKGQPDTYGGTNWFNVVACVPSGGNDQCGVHNNSGVMNKWFYLVTQGNSGTNDLGSVYSVTGIGFAKSQNILYQTELVLSSTADYALMRATSINTTITLYGDCSPEVITVTNAWYAVGVGAAYVPNPAAITGAANICIGGTATLADVTAGGAWISGGTLVASVGPTTGLVTGISAGTALISYSLGGGCIATTVATVNAFPVATISPAGTSVICAGGSSVLTAGAGVGFTYQWKVGGIIIPGATNANYIAAIGGSYSVVVANAVGCTTTSSTSVVSIVAPPTASITTSSPTTFCAGGSSLLNANPGIGYTYQWQSGGSPVPGATAISYTASAAGSITVVVTNPSGCGITSAATTINVTPLPSASVTPTGSTIFCMPANVILDANIGTGLTYQWLKDGVVISGASLASYTAYVSGNFTVVVTKSSCSTTSSGVAVSAEALAVAPITGASNVCIGNIITLADASAGGTWSSGATTLATVGGSGIVSGISAGTVNISYTYTNTCGISVTSHPVTIHTPTPVAPVTGSLSVCVGGISSLFDGTTSGVWSSVSPATATISGVGGLTGVAAGTTQISYTVTNAFGCISAAVASVIINPLPAGAISPAGPIGICPGGNSLLSAPGGYTYQWQSGGVNIPGATTAAFTTTGAGNFRVLMTNGFGCVATSTAVAVSVNPSLLVTPSVNISAIPGSILCVVPSPVSFTATPVNGGSAPSLQWFVNGAGTATGATFNYTPASGDVVRCKLVSNNSCASPDTASSSMNMLISPLRTPSVTISANPSVICSGIPVTFTALPVFGGIAPTYRWSRNDTNVATGPNYIYVPHNGDILKVTLFSDYPCLLIDSANSPAFDITTHAPVPNTISISVTQSGIAAGSLDTFVAIAPNGGGAPLFQWFINGTAIPGATASYYVTSSLTAGEVINCKVTSSLPCAMPPTATSGGITVRIIPVGVQQTTGTGGNISLTPNPNKGTFDIEGSLNSLTDSRVNIVVTDLLGQAIYKHTTEVLSGHFIQHVALDNSIASGMYLVSITSGENHVVYHMVLNK
jgi:Zn-dependent metalloprotease